jgi:cysteine synthase A
MLGMNVAIQELNNIADNNKNIFVFSQFTNLINPLTHQLTTAVEIYDDLDGKVDVIVSGIGSGGTITGVGNYLHMVGETVVIGVEPSESPLISKGISNTHKIEGIGPNFVPDVLDMSAIDKIETIDFETAIEGVKMLASEE